MNKNSNKMKKIKYSQNKINLISTIVVIASIFVLTSCEKVIEIDLNSSNPVLVAEGQITKDSTVWVKLSYTSDYFNNEEMDFEENASVVLTNGSNDSEILDYLGNGLYKGNILQGKIDENYKLDIKTDKSEYSATSTLMPPGEIYEIVISESEMKRPGQKDTTYSLEIKFRDVSVAEDFYMIKIFINGLLDSYALVDDKIFLIGDTISFPLMRKEFYKNDEVIIKLHSVDKDAYRYYNQLNDAVSDGKGPGGSSTPYNPYSNFGEKVMGYFVAWSYVSETVVVK